jgi:hypothetical protein
MLLLHQVLRCGYFSEAHDPSRRAVIVPILCHIKKSGLLRNNAEFGTQIIQANCCYVDAINEDTATGWFNYAEKHLNERCLSTSSTSNHSELLPSSD